MKSEAKFKMYFGSRAATVDELSHIEEITVEQEMDMAWHANIKMFLCLDEKGNWSHLQDDYLQSFQRVRVELQLGGGAWVPLIDGPIVDRQPNMDSQPGRSSITLSVNDDSAFLNRNATVKVNSGDPDSDIAKALFDLAPAIARKEIKSVPASADRLAPAQVRRGTAMQQLRRLAQRHEKFHAYVLPGAKPGESIGYFQPDPTRVEGLPDLILLGADRNLSTLQVTEEAQTPTRFRARSLSITDKQIVSRTSRFQNLDLLAPKPLLQENQTGTQVLSPHENNEDDPDRAVQAAGRSTTYSLRANGRVIPGCYPGVLRPYQLVTLRVGKTGLSGMYLLTRATHRITPSLHTQEFAAKRDGVEKTKSGDLTDVLGGIL